MKFLNIFCERRGTMVYLSLDKIVLITALEDKTLIEIQGASEVEVRMPAEELVRMINGENRTGIGFRAGR